MKVSTPVILVDPATGEAYTTLSPLPVSATVEPPEGGATEAAQDEQTVLLTAIRAGVKAEDTASAGGDSGVPAMAVRQDSLAASVDTDGDYGNVKTDSLGRLWVTGTWLEDAAHANGAAGHFVLAVRNDAGTALAGTDLDYIGLTTDAQGRLWIAGTQTEDAVHASGDRGIMALGVRTDTAAALAGTTGDYMPFIFDSLGKLWTTGTYLEDAVHATGDKGSFVLAVRADTAAATGANGDYVAFIVDANGKLWMTGTYLTDAAAGASDQVVAVGAIRDDALAALTPVDGDYDRLRVDKWGRLHVRESLDEYEAVAASQSTQTLGATGAAGDILSHVLIVPGTTSPGAVSIKDGSNAAITIFVGGAASVQSLIPFTVPIGARSVQGAWQITTGADVTAIGFGEFT